MIASTFCLFFSFEFVLKLVLVSEKYIFFQWWVQVEVYELWKYWWVIDVHLHNIRTFQRTKKKKKVIAFLCLHVVIGVIFTISLKNIPMMCKYDYYLLLFACNHLFFFAVNFGSKPLLLTIHLSSTVSALITTFFCSKKKKMTTFLCRYLMGPDMEFVKFFGKNNDVNSLTDGIIKEIKQQKK